MTKIEALSPSGFTVEVTCPDAEGDVCQWLLDIDKWLSHNNFKPLPVSMSNRNDWKSKARNWIEAEGNNLYVYFAWTGKDKAENDANKKKWLDIIHAATGVMGTTEHELFGKDAKGRDIWTYVYSISKGRELLDVLPENEFERKPKLQARLVAKKEK